MSPSFIFDCAAASPDLIAQQLADYLCAVISNLYLLTLLHSYTTKL